MVCAQSHQHVKSAGILLQCVLEIYLVGFVDTFCIMLTSVQGSDVPNCKMGLFLAHHSGFVLYAVHDFTIDSYWTCSPCMLNTFCR